MRVLGRLFMKGVVVLVIALLTLPAWSRYDDYLSCEEPVLAAADNPASAPLSEEIPQEDGHVIGGYGRVVAPAPPVEALDEPDELLGLDSHDVNTRDANERLFRPPRHC